MQVLTLILQLFYSLLGSSLDCVFPLPLDCIFRTLFQRDFALWGCLPQSNLGRFGNRLEPILVQKWVQVPSPKWTRNPYQKWGRKAYPNLGRPLRMRARSHSERASPFLVRIPSPFWVRIPYPFWVRIPTHFGYGFRPHFWARNQSSRFETRANFEHGNRAQNGDGSGIRYEKFNPNMTKKCGPTRNEKNNNLVINSA